MNRLKNDTATGDLFAPKEQVAMGKPGAASAKEVAWFEKLLLGAKCWMTASDILLSVGREVDDSGKRWLKSLCAETVQVIGGQKGYRHVDHASDEEVSHAASRLESAAKVMSERACAIRSYRHQRIGGRRLPSSEGGTISAP